MSSLLAGLAIGLAIAASPGPISFLTVRRTLERGWPSGLASGLGVATADAAYAALAAFGVAAVTSVLVGQRRWFELVGGLALMLLGGRSALRPPTIRSDEAPGPANLAAMYASMVGLTLANPPTILSFAAVFAGLGLVARYPLLLVAGVMLGSALWWLLLTGAVALVRRRIEPVARWIALGSGLLVAGFGAAAIVTVLFKS